MAGKQKSEGGSVIATALQTIHYVVDGKVVVAAPGDPVEIEADEVDALVARRAIALQADAEPVEPTVTVTSDGTGSAVTIT